MSHGWFSAVEARARCVGSTGGVRRRADGPTGRRTPAQNKHADERDSKRASEDASEQCGTRACACASEGSRHWAPVLGVQRKAKRRPRRTLRAACHAACHVAWCAPRVACCAAALDKQRRDEIFRAVRDRVPKRRAEAERAAPACTSELRARMRARARERESGGVCARARVRACVRACVRIRAWSRRVPDQLVDFVLGVREERRESAEPLNKTESANRRGRTGRQLAVLSPTGPDWRLQRS